MISRLLTPALLLLAVLACAGAENDASVDDTLARSTAVEVVDPGGATVRLERPAERVVSLVPSGTDLIVAMGGARQIAGRTRYDSAPEVAALPSVGGGLDPSIEALAAVRPELVLAWELSPVASTRGQIEALGIRTYALQTPDTASLFRSVAAIGHLIGRDSAASALASRLRTELDSVRRLAAAAGPRPSVFYVVSTSPAMTAGPDTFAGQLVSVAGGANIFPELGAAWPQVSLEEVVRRDPDIVILPVGEDPTNSLAELRRKPGWREIPAVREGRVVTVPADLMNRPGPRIGEAAMILYEAMRGSGFNAARSPSSPPQTSPAADIRAPRSSSRR